MSVTIHSEVGRGVVARTGTMRPVPLSPKEVGARIRRARELLGMSRFDLAVRAGVSPATIQRWEEGKLPSVNKLVKLAAVLDQAPDYLTEPPEKRAELQDLHDLLAEARGEAERGREALISTLVSIDARLSHIEAQLGTQADRDSARS